MSKRGNYLYKIHTKKRETNEMKISELLDFFLNYYNIPITIKEGDIIQAWRDITGAYIEKMTTKIYVQNSCLYVQVNSPSLKNELMMVRTDLLKKIQERVKDSGLNNIYIK